LFLYASVLGDDPFDFVPEGVRASELGSDGRFGPLESIDLPGRIAWRTRSIDGTAYMTAYAGGENLYSLGRKPMEVEFLRTGRGPIRNMLEALGVWTDAWRVPACDPVQYLAEVGYLRPGVMVVHAVHLSDQGLERLRQAIRELPPEYQSCVTLKYLEDLGVAEIAEALQVPVGTVKTWLFRARDLLVQKLKPYVETLL
jgi:hypothetical protein